MEHIGNLRENVMHEGVTVGAHQDGRLSDEDLLIVAITASPDGGGEFVASLSPDEGAFIILPAKARHQVLKIQSGTRRSITAVLTPKRGESHS